MSPKYSPLVTFINEVQKDIMHSLRKDCRKKCNYELPFKYIQIMMCTKLINFYVL